jgi:hypothetical protein
MQIKPRKRRMVIGSIALLLATAMISALIRLSTADRNLQADNVSAGIPGRAINGADEHEERSSVSAAYDLPMASPEGRLGPAGTTALGRGKLDELADLALRAREGDFGSFQRLQQLLSFCRHMAAHSRREAASDALASSAGVRQEDKEASSAYVLARAEALCPEILPPDLADENQYWSMWEELLNRSPSEELLKIEALSAIDTHGSDAEAKKALASLERIARETTSPELLWHAALEITSGRHGAWPVGKEAIEGTLAEARLPELQAYGALLAACDRGADCGPGSLRYLQLCAPHHCRPGDGVYQFINRSVSSMESAAVAETRDWFLRK